MILLAVLMCLFGAVRGDFDPKSLGARSKQCDTAVVKNGYIPLALCAGLLPASVLPGDIELGPRSKLCRAYACALRAMGCKEEMESVEATITAGGGSVGGCGTDLGLDPKICEQAGQLLYNFNIPDPTHLSKLKDSFSICSPFADILKAVLPKVGKYIGTCADTCHYAACGVSLLCQNAAKPAIDAIKASQCTTSTSLQCAVFDDTMGDHEGPVVDPPQPMSTSWSGEPTLTATVPGGSVVSEPVGSRATDDTKPPRSKPAAGMSRIHVPGSASGASVYNPHTKTGGNGAPVTDTNGHVKTFTDAHKQVGGANVTRPSIDPNSCEAIANATCIKCVNKGCLYCEKAGVCLSNGGWFGPDQGSKSDLKKAEQFFHFSDDDTQCGSWQFGQCWMAGNVLLVTGGVGAAVLLCCMVSCCVFCICRLRSKRAKTRGYNILLDNSGRDDTVALVDNMVE